MAEEFKGRNQDRKEFKVVGRRNIPGRQSFALATGLAKYPKDIVVPGMLFGKVLRSPYGRARIKSMDISKAQALPGIKAVITWEDPEIQAMPSLDPMWLYPLIGTLPVLSNEAEREGDEVGVCIAAESEEICDEALKLIKIEWEILPHILDPREGIKPDAPVLYPELGLKTNIGHEVNWEDGNVEAGFKEADKIIEYEQSTPRVCHHFSNPTTSVAWWENDHTGTEGKTLVIDTPKHIQRTGPQYVAMESFHLPEDKVHVLTPYWGGKYCGFTPWRIEALAPLLAKRTGRPVKMDHSRRDEFGLAAAQAWAHMKIGFKNDGTICAAYGKQVQDLGTKGSYHATSSMAAFRTTRCPNVKQEAVFVYTNTARLRTGPTQGTFDLLASAIGLVADALGMDPTEVALKNCHTPEPSLRLCIEEGKKAIGWAEKWHLAGKKRLPNGKMHGLGFKYHDSPVHGVMTYTATITIKEDGKVYMPYHEALLGTYWPDACAMVIAEELGARIEDVIVHFVPNMTSWMQGTARDRGSSATWVAKEAAIDLKEKLLNYAAAAFKVKPEELDTRDSTVYIKADPARSYTFKKFGSEYRNPLVASYSGKPPAYDITFKTLTAMNAVFCEVEVDTETGEIEITKWVGAADAGKVIRPTSFEGQVELGLIFNTGQAKMEEVIWDKKTGVKLNASTLEYKPPTILDIPPMTIPTIETRCAGGCYGATGQSHSIADRVTVSLAVYNAIGKWIDNPITPDKVLAALGKI